MPAVVTVADATALTPLTAILVLSPVDVAVATTTPAVVAAPVENPAVNVPVYFPKFAEVVFASVKADEVVPEEILLKAVATSAFVIFTLAVKVKPLTVTNSFGFKG